MTRRLALFTATFVHVGDFPIAPGTVGSVAGMVVYYLLGRFVGLTLPIQGAVIIALFLLGAWSGTEAERHFGATDPGPVVIDEVMGMFITLFGVPVGWSGLLIAFFVFRVMDIIKPFPASRFEHLPGGWGIMADDGMAAVYGNIVMRLLAWLAPAILGAAWFARP
jgi:phosphatidylglycerophosphatase A